MHGSNLIPDPTPTSPEMQAAVAKVAAEFGAMIAGCSVKPTVILLAPLPPWLYEELSHENAEP